jgi:hypothetical protein
VFNAADVIEALAQRRRLKSNRPWTPGKLPPGWQSWLDGMSTSQRAIKGALPQDVIAEVAQRPLSSPPKRLPALTRWQAFRTLLRQQWNPPDREERGTRIFAALFSGALHAVFLVLLTILAWVQIPPPPGTAGETVVQVEFIGKGTPEETGGGAPEGPAPEPAPAPAAPAAPSAMQTPAETTQAPPPSEAQPTPEPPTEPAAVATQPEPEPTPPEPQPPAQPLQVTEVAVPDTTFVLAPTRPREVQLPEPQIVVPELKQPKPGVARVAVPQQQVLQVEQTAPQRVTTAPTLRAEEEARLSQARALNAPTTNAPELQVPALRAQVQALPRPSRGTQPSAQSGTTPSANPAASSTTAATTPSGGPPSPGSGTQPAAQAGTGTNPSAKPGAWPTPQRGDDFGVGTRNRPGAAPGTPGAQAGSKPGLFKADGTPNLGEAPTPQRNAPGTPEAKIADLDKAGRWLKRPPYDYTPTTFDKYWRPNETLLQEWVRKGIRSLEIPIPGTNKRISCMVSVLALGGACGLTDPNHNEQPASARPPPDIPFKPELQENNGSVRPAPAPAPPATTVRPPGA